MQIKLQEAMFSEDGSLKPAFASLLKRARGVPVSLNTTADWSAPGPRGTVQTSPVEQPQRPLRKLLDVVGRSLTRLVLTGSLNRELPCLPSGTFPSLQSFVCDVELASRAFLKEGEEVSLSCFCDAPALRRVALNTASLVPLEILFTLPWEQLTHFREVDRRKKRPHFLTHILPKCSKLRWLGVGLNDDDVLFFDESFDELPETVYDGMHGTVITLPNLRTLSLGPVFDGPLKLRYPFIFDIYEFPNLRSLRMSSDDAGEYGHHGDRFLRKLATFAKLEYLSFHAELFSADTLTSIIQALPHLSTLHLSANRQHSYNNVLRALALVEDSTGSHSSTQTTLLLPNLRTLVLYHCLSESPRDPGEEEWFGFMDNPTGRVWPLKWETLNLKDLEQFLTVRTQYCAPEARLRKLFVYGPSADDVADDRKFVRCIQRYADSGELQFERRICKHGSRDSAIWMELDPEVRGWEEATILLSFDY